MGVHSESGMGVNNWESCITLHRKEGGGVRILLTLGMKTLVKGLAMATGANRGEQKKGESIYPQS